MTILADYLATAPAELRPLVRALDAIVRKAAPKLTPSLKWGNLTYHAEKNLIAIVAHRKHVNLQLWNGAALKDPKGLLEGAGKTMRHVKVASTADLDAKYLTGLVKQVVKLAG